MGIKTGFGNKKIEVIARMLDLSKNSGMKKPQIAIQICKEYGISNGTVAYFIKQWSRENEELRLAMANINTSYRKESKKPKKPEKPVVIDNRASAKLTNEIGIAKTLELIEANFNRAEVVQWLMQEYKLTYSNIARRMQKWSLKNEIIAEKLGYKDGKTTAYVSVKRAKKTEGLPNPHIGKHNKPEQPIVTSVKPVEEHGVSVEFKPQYDPVYEFQQIVKCYAEHFHQPNKDEIEGLQEYFVILTHRGLDPILWLTSVIKEIGKKSPQKKNLSYLIGLIRTRMIKGWGISKNEDEEYIIAEIEKMLNSELEHEQRIKIYQLMAQEGSLRLFAAISKIDVRDIFIAKLFEFLQKNPRSEIRKALGSDWVVQET